MNQGLWVRLWQTLHLPGSSCGCHILDREAQSRQAAWGWVGEGVGSRLTETGRWRNLSDWWSLLERLKCTEPEPTSKASPLDGNSRVSGRRGLSVTTNSKRPDDYLVPAVH